MSVAQAFRGVVGVIRFCFYKNKANLKSWFVQQLNYKSKNL